LCTEATGLTKNGVMLRPKHYNPDAGEIDSMNVSVAAILIFEAKDNEDFKLPILGYRIKKKKKNTKL
jgi:tRNA G18 (ribose-2'-O)-methylase SpoU